MFGADIVAAIQADAIARYPQESCGLVTAAGYEPFAKASLERLRQMEICLSRTREQLAREYATKADLHADVGRVLDRLDKLDSKLDRLLTARVGGAE